MSRQDIKDRVYKLELRNPQHETPDIRKLNGKLVVDLELYSEIPFVVEIKDYCKGKKHYTREMKCVSRKELKKVEYKGDQLIIIINEETGRRECIELS